MHVLVTGASGLVGEAICYYFISENCKVTGIVNSSSLNIINGNYTELTLNLLETHLVLSQKKYDAVIHCAAIIADATKTNEELFATNQKIDALVFNFCITHHIKLIYFSTAYLYANNTNNTLNESSLINDELEGYYLSKYTSEQQLINSDINYVVYRLSSPYGNYQKQNNVMKLFINKMKNNDDVTLLGKGERSQNFIHTQDIAEVCLLSLNHTIKGIYNLCYDRTYSMYELASVIKTTLRSNSEIRCDESKKDTIINVNFSNVKLCYALNWRPKYNLENGIQQTLLT